MEIFLQVGCTELPSGRGLKNVNVSWFLLNQSVLYAQFECPDDEVITIKYTE